MVRRFRHKTILLFYFERLKQKHFGIEEVICVLRKLIKFDQVSSKILCRNEFSYLN